MGVHELKKQLRYLGVGKLQMLHSEVPVLAQILDDNELLKAVVFGMHESGYGVLAATDQRVLFVDKMVIGSKCDNIAYNTISDISTSFTPFMYNQIHVYTKAKDFNFRYVKRAQIMRFASYVEQKVARATNFSVRPAQLVTS